MYKCASGSVCQWFSMSVFQFVNRQCVCMSLCVSVDQYVDGLVSICTSRQCGLCQWASEGDCGC